LSIDALNNVVMVQDPTPIAGKVVIEATTAGIVHRTVTWSQLQRMMPKLIALEAAREIDFYVTDTPSDDPRGVELGLAGLPAISYLTEGSGPIVPGAVATTDHVLTGVNFLAGQSQAQVRLGSATVDNDAILIRAIQPGPGGAEYTVAITDNGGGATTFAAVPLLSNNLVISTDITGPITYATLAAEINALAGVGAYGASGIPLEAEIPGTGAGNVVIEATTALVGGAGPGLTITVGGVTGDITWADILGTTVRFGIDLSASGPAASTSVITAVLRAGKQITEVDIPMLASALQFKGSITIATDFPLIAIVQPGWMYRVLANVTDNAGVTYTNTGQIFLPGAEIAWNGTTWSEMGTETETRAINVAVDMAAVLPNVMTLQGIAANAFIFKEAIFTVNAGAAALAGDVTVSIGTTAGGAEIMAATPLTGLDGIGETFRIAMVGIMPVILANAALDLSVTIGDTAGTGTMTVVFIGEEM
jgi:hypothetical protein